MIEQELLELIEELGKLTDEELEALVSGEVGIA